MGLRRGDTIVAINGRPTSTTYEFRLAEARLGRGEAARIKVERAEGEIVEIEVPSRAFSVAGWVRERMGFVARDATGEDAPKLGVSPDAASS